MPQTRGPPNKKRYKSASPESNRTQSSSLVEIVGNSKGSITSTYDSLLKKTKTCIGRFFYENGLDFGAVNSPSFQRMISLLFGQTKCQLPSCEELKGWIFEDAMKEMRAYVGEIRKSWADTGCSILLDEWTNANGRNLVNVLVDCPKGTVYLCSSDVTDCIGNMDAMLLFFVKVIAGVGKKNVVQIITNSNSAFMKEVGKQLMDKYRSIFWTVSASYCIELMLEKLKGMDLIKDTLSKAKTIARFIRSHPNAMKFLQDQTDGSDLLNPSKIKSVQPFLTLENIVLEKEILMKMFPSSDPNCEISTSTAEGKRAAELVADRSFWSAVSTVLNGAISLVRVIEWLNETNKEQLGYIYETIDQVKETIKQGLKNKKQYAPFWNVIDEVWNEVLHSSLHSAGYMLNPNFFYSTGVYIDSEVVAGLLCCFVRSSRDTSVQDRLTIQLEMYRTAQGAFSVGYRADQRSKISPALWWSKYGGECPDLQRLAVRILSQTCDGTSKFRLKRSWAEETLITYGRDRTERKLLSDAIFLRYNMQLRNFASGKANYLTSDEVDPLDDWIMDKSSD